VREANWPVIGGSRQMKAPGTRGDRSVPGAALYSICVRGIELAKTMHERGCRPVNERAPSRSHGLGSRQLGNSKN